MDSDYHRLTVQLLFCAKQTNCELERAQLFKIAEQWSMRAQKEDCESPVQSGITTKVAAV